MSSNLAAQQKLAERLGTVLRRFEHEGGNIDELADTVGETARDLRRWADGTKLPGHVFSALLAELPRHLADALIRPTGLRLVARRHDLEAADAMVTVEQLALLAADIARRHVDGFCHRDRAQVAIEARKLITQLESLAARCGEHSGDSQ